MNKKPSHRPRFTLRALLVAVAVCAIPMGWVSYSLRWIHNRQEFRIAHGRENLRHTFSSEQREKQFAPGFLWLFGEPPVYAWSARDLNANDLAEGQELFPESEFLHYNVEGRP